MGNTKRRTASEWSALIASQQSSGQTIAGFCEVHQLNPGTFYYWRSKLDQLSSEAPGFVALHTKAPNKGSIIVRLRKGIEIELPGDYSPKALSEFIGLLGC